MDLGLGYPHEASNARVEFYINNVTDDLTPPRRASIRRTQEPYFTPPLTFVCAMQ